MPNIAKVLKEEIQRIAKREAKALVQPINKERIALKKQISALKKQVDRLDRDKRKLTKAVQKVEPKAVSSDAEGTRKKWVTAKGVRSMRKKLKLSQAEFAKLAGVSGQTVYQWERQDGKLQLRSKTYDAVMRMRQLSGSREAQRLLEKMD